MLISAATICCFGASAHGSCQPELAWTDLDANPAHLFPYVVSVFGTSEEKKKGLKNTLSLLSVFFCSLDSRRKRFKTLVVRLIVMVMKTPLDLSSAMTTIANEAMMVVVLATKMICCNPGEGECTGMLSLRVHSLFFSLGFEAESRFWGFWRNWGLGFGLGFLIWVEINF